MEYLTSTLTISITVFLISFIILWIGKGKGNGRVVFFAFFPLLFALAVFVFDAFRYRYTPADYTQKHIEISKCRYIQPAYKQIVLHDLEIIAQDGAYYGMSRAMLWRSGSEKELAAKVCGQKQFDVWLNPENEITGIKNENIDIPLETGIIVDNSKHDFIMFGYIFGGLGLCLLILAVICTWFGIKIETNWRKI
ncbi:MAG TPA: hypothetical protein PKY59_20395 [Pyrinomonadaceae bacterium]|nr:hypothetical protein [Pyrinomonadaceae bacterium]